MPHRIFTILDATISITTIVTTAAAALLTSTAPPSTVAELQMTLIPLIGALISSGGMIMLNPQPETRSIVIGRSFIALLFAAITPQIIALAWPSTAGLIAHTVVLLGLGGSSCMVYFAVSRPFCRKLYERSDALAQTAIQIAESKTRQIVGEVVESAVNGKIDRAAVKAVDVATQKAKEVLATAQGGDSGK